MNKGFVRIIEVMLAISIIFIVMNNIYTTTPPRYQDTQNINWLHRNAEDIAFSMCYNEEKRALLIDGRIPEFDLTTPSELDYHIWVYTNNSLDWKLDDLINESGNTPKRTTATASCLISASNSLHYGHCYISSTCIQRLARSDDYKVSVNSGENLHVLFEGSKTSPEAVFTLEALQGGAGTTSIYFFNGTGLQLMHSYSFSQVQDESHEFDVKSYLPDARGHFNITINSTADNDYDFASLSTDVYAPKKLVVGVWNKYGN